MSMRDIPPGDWPAFLEKLAREHRAWLATVELNGTLEVRNEPLESIAAERGIDIRIGRRILHVDEPRAVRADDRGLEIDDAAGGRLTLRFRVAEAPGALDGLAPAERR